MTQLAWHYTTAEKFALIIESGELRTTLSQVTERRQERPVLWFSMDQFWEGTVVYTREVNGRIKSCSMLETQTAGCGLVRLGYPMAKVIPWLELWKPARIKPNMKRFLEKAGREKGANPYHWFGCFSPVLLSELVVEVMNIGHTWETVSRGLIVINDGRAVNIVGDGMHDVSGSNRCFLSDEVTAIMNDGRNIFKSMCKMDENITSELNITSVATRAKAIEVGILINLTSLYPDMCSSFFSFQICCTDSVWETIRLSDQSPEKCKDKEGVIFDILHLGRAAYLRNPSCNEHSFSVFITGIGSNNYYDFKITLGIGDTDEPVITLLLPEEY
jgi:hypothetical protein